MSSSPHMKRPRDAKIRTGGNEWLIFGFEHDFCGKKFADMLKISAKEDVLKPEPGTETWDRCWWKLLMLSDVFRENCIDVLSY